MLDDPLIGLKQGIWPQPQKILRTDGTRTIDPELFKFELDENIADCDILVAAIERYQILTFIDDCVQLTNRTTGSPLIPTKVDSSKPCVRAPDTLTKLLIEVHSSVCEKYPYQDMDEAYKLDIERTGEASLSANSIWGALRGLETFSQLVYPTTSNGLFQLNCTYIVDYPRFTHRGLLIDTSRHFLPLAVIRANLDAMSYNKMNVFHWHLVDDPSFPFVSTTFPELSEQGSFLPNKMIYSPSDVQEVIEYARVRGIRVMPEFDTPGHTQSWRSIEGLLTPCYNTTTGMPNGKFGPVDPTRKETYKFMAKLFKEIATTFPEQYIHLGGDEVDFTCWKTNPNVKKFMANHKLNSTAQLEGYYMQRLVNIVGNLNASYAAWQEIFDHGAQLKEDAVIHVWIGRNNATEWRQELAKVTAAGYRALLSAPWYLDDIAWGADWPRGYKADPHSFNGTAEQNKLVIGGEACMWGEYVDGSNSVSRTWPRALASAEKLWSSSKLTDFLAAVPRMEVQRCRMQRRGLKVEPPNGPGTCYCDDVLI